MKRPVAISTKVEHVKTWIFLDIWLTVRKIKFGVYSTKK